MKPWPTWATGTRSRTSPTRRYLAEGTWHLDKAQHELESLLSKAKNHGCVVEVVMKDISTVCYQPHRLWEWARMATEVTQRYSH